MRFCGSQPTDVREADAASALKDVWMFSNMQFMYTHSFWRKEMHLGPKPALKPVRNLFSPFQRVPLHLEAEARAGGMQMCGTASPHVCLTLQCNSGTKPWPLLVITGIRNLSHCCHWFGKPTLYILISF